MARPPAPSAMARGRLAVDVASARSARAAIVRSMGQAPSSRARRTRRHSSDRSWAPRVCPRQIRSPSAATSRPRSACALAAASQLRLLVSSVVMGRCPFVDPVTVGHHSPSRERVACGLLQNLTLPFVLNGDLQRWGLGCQGLRCYLTDHRAHVFEQHRHSLELTLIQRLFNCGKAQCLDLVK